MADQYGALWPRRRRGIVLALVMATAVGMGLARRQNAAALPGIDTRQLAALQARFIGPVGVSGRVTAIEAVEDHPEVIYAGAAAGGVWKSSDAGASWQPLFEAEPVASIGSLAVCQSHPEVVWVGTEEANFHATVAAGNGVYRSADGGRTWIHAGLAASRHIARIVPHPSNPEVAWVAATGPSWREGGERGVFKTDDGGKSWRRVLFVDEATGAGDLALDPGNPERLLAGMWQVRRWPWEPAQGLPAGRLGRMKLAFARSRPQIAYAMIEIERAGVLMRSEDGGRTWKEVSRHPNLFPRPFFFGEMKVDPRQPDRLYSLHFDLDVSNDGGKSWDDRLFSEVHPDMHALWIDPRDPHHLLIGTDGGVYASRDGGQTAARLGELPVAQLYRVAVDLEVPYHVYAGSQDNGSWRGPSASWEAGGIYEPSWQMLGGGDGTAALPDPSLPGQGYAIAQNGDLERWDLASGEWRDLRPRVPSPPTLQRFGWVTPLALDPFAPGTLYCGSQSVLRSTDRGRSWTAISPDLTTNDPAWQRQELSGGLTPDVGGAETYTTISAISPSPLAPGLLWVGTDDGRIQITRDGGASWRSVEQRLAGVPAHASVARILASRFAAGSAYALLDDHRSGDDATYVVQTDDYGASWRRLAAGGVRGSARAIEQDPVDPDLLFLGTDAGLWISLDGGARWVQWPSGPAAASALPPAPVADLVVYPRDHDLVIATFGRGIFVIDDVSPLRHLEASTLAEPLHLFPVADARQHQVRFESVGGRSGPRGRERPYGALLTFWAGPPPAPAQPPAADSRNADSAPPEAEIRIADGGGRVVRRLTAPVRPGLNRIVWGLEHDALTRRPRDGGRGPLPTAPGPGPEVPSGTYHVTVRAGSHEANGTVRVVADPRSTNTEADWQLRWAAIRRVEELRQAVVEAVEHIRRARADLATLRAQPAAPQSIQHDAAALESNLAKTEARLVKPPRSPIGEAHHELSTRLSLLEDALASGLQPPSPAQAADLQEAEKEVGDLLQVINQLFADRVKPLRDRLVPPGSDLLAPEPSPVLPPAGHESQQARLPLDGVR